LEILVRKKFTMRNLVIEKESAFPNVVVFPINIRELFPTCCTGTPGAVGGA
jgi:hypothetical protein